MDSHSVTSRGAWTTGLSEVGSLGWQIMEKSQKTVLVTYLELKKQFVIPSNKNVSDVEYLACCFKIRKAFSYGNNVNVDISFQMYDASWDEFVEIDEDSEINDRAKIKAVIMPSLATPTESEVRHCVFYFSIFTN